MRSGNGSGSFLAMMRLNKIARDEASAGDNRVSHHPLVKAGKSPLDLPIIRIITFMIVFAVSFSLVIPGGLFNHQVALADTAIDNASTSYTPVRAPLNPAFVAYMNSKSGLQSMSLSASSPILGLIPAPLDMSGLTGEQIDTPGSFSVYSSSGSFDLRTQNKVYSSKKPGQFRIVLGFCSIWLDGIISCCRMKPGISLKITLKIMPDLTWTPIGGGNYEMAMAYLTRWSGPISESDDPFVASSTTSPTGPYKFKNMCKMPIIIPDRISSTDNDNIKLALTNYGAIFTSMYMVKYLSVL